VLEDIYDEQIVEAVEESWWEIMKYLASTPWGKIVDDEHLKKVYFNLWDSVVITNLNEENVEQKIKETTEWYSNLGTHYSWWVSPKSKPETLEKHLEKQGFYQRTTAAAMAINLNKLDKTPTIEDVEIKKVIDSAMLPVWSKVFLVGHGFGEVLSKGSKVFNAIGIGGSAVKYLGFYKGDPVASSQIYYGEKVARLNFVTTLPCARGKGIGSAISLTSLNDACEHGYKVAVLYARDMGYSIYKRFGFKDICEIKLYGKRIT
jgi:ribosomal protein S18 acetylase RimI-like enzyme